MRSDIDLQKKLLSPPGDTIQETIDTLGMTQTELAERIGRPKEKLNSLIKGNDPLTLKTAVLLERVLGIPVNFWMEREREYRIQLSKIEQQEFLSGCIDWLKHFPVTALKKIEWLPQTTNKSELADALLRFFGVASPVEWDNIYVSKKISATFKISLANTPSPHAISAWLRIGEKKLRQQQLSEFNKKEFHEVLIDIKDLVLFQPDDFLIQLQKRCAKCGVAVLYTLNLPKAPIAGATWWRGNNPIIQLSGRYKTNDSFWFAFYHEAGHILKHGKKEVFLENVQGSIVDEIKEKEADEFAQRHLFPSSALKRLKEISRLTEIDIKKFAAMYNMHPAIIVGQLQHEKIIPYSRFNHLKVSISIFG